MAKQTIDVGTTANDGTGDPLRTSMTKVNDNFTELYNTPGWGFYVDDLSTPTISIGTTPTKLTINGLGAGSSSDYLPYEIRGISELWDTSANKFTPINVGDSYTTRINFTVASESGNPTDITLLLDIGGSGTPTNVVLEKHIAAGKVVPYSISIASPTFAGATQVANGAQLFINTDSGTITVGERSIFISRLSNGNL